MLATKEPAAAVWKAESALEPMSTGLKMPWPKLLSWAAVAPVAPLLLSKVMPAQRRVPGATARKAPAARPPVTVVTPELKAMALKEKPV